MAWWLYPKSPPVLDSQVMPAAVYGALTACWAPCYHYKSWYVTSQQLEGVGRCISQMGSEGSEGISNQPKVTVLLKVVLG